MPVIPLPPEHSYRISERARHFARQLAPRRTGQGARDLMPVMRPGQVGVKVARRSYYMVYQDLGTRPRIMWELQGKTIPIRDPQGNINFRVASNVGQRQITARDERGRIVESKIAWRHPGITAKHFRKEGVERAIREFLDDVDEETALEILMEYPGINAILSQLTRD